MAVTTIVATAKAANANAYVTVAELDQHLTDRLGATLLAKSSDDKIRAILRATEKHDNEVDWTGTAAWPTTSTQALLFPVTGLIDPIHGTSVDSDTVPAFLKSAVSEWAASLLSSGEPSATGPELESLRMGVVTATKRSAKTQVNPAVPERVMQYLRPYGAVPRAARARAVR